ncbi:hypothetical protein LQ51_16265 [Micromonospora sp. HK10]|nr:hypothetical protein LQ51_16265 [Micromonospora sp. HK10]
MPLVIAPLLVPACGKAVAPAVHKAAPVAEHEAAAGSSARRIADETASRAGWTPDGRLLTSDGAEAATRAEVTAELDRMLTPYPADDLRDIVRAACWVRDGSALLNADNPDEQMVEAAGRAGVRTAQVYGLLRDLHDADSSGEITRIAAAALLCELAGA